MNEIGLNSQTDVRLYVQDLEPLQVLSWRLGTYWRSELHIWWVRGSGAGRTETHEGTIVGVAK